MSQIFDQLGQEFDLLLIDTPPLLTVTDAAALATGMDGVILVVKPGVTKLTAIQQGLEQLRAVGARVLGVVLNEVNPGSRKYGYYLLQHLLNMCN
jgi:non-specific protein-tyrosine kinase